MSTIPLTVIIVDKTGTLKSYNIKDFKEEELYKKCGFKKAEGFIKQTEWNIKIDGRKWFVSVYGKTDGRANSENKYDFPPPIDSKLFFGNCVLVLKVKDDKNMTFTNLSIPLWDKLYEKLFGGFEDLTNASCVLEDEMEPDELDQFSESKKTKVGGYLKDGFVVDSDDDEDVDGSVSDDYETDTNEDSVVEPEEVLNIVDIGSELSEESYDYSEDNLVI